MFFVHPIILIYVPRSMCSPINVRCIFIFALCLYYLLSRTPTVISGNVEIMKNMVLRYRKGNKWKEGKRERKHFSQFLWGSTFSIIGSCQEAEWLCIGVVYKNFTSLDECETKWHLRSFPTLKFLNSWKFQKVRRGNILC